MLTWYATKGLQPDLLIILDIDPGEGVRRKVGDQADRIEQKSMDFHQRVRAGFRQYAEHLGSRAVVLDADRPAEVIAAEALELVLGQ